MWQTSLCNAAKSCEVQKIDNCNKLNHFEAACPSCVQINEIAAQPKHGGEGENDHDFYIDSIEANVNKTLA